MLIKDDIHTLRHALGIEWPHQKSWRNYLCTELPDPQMERLSKAGLMEPGRFVPGSDKQMRYFHVTECGELVAREDIPRKTRAQLRYLNFLDLCDCYPDLTFRDFLTHPQFKEARTI